MRARPREPAGHVNRFRCRQFACPSLAPAPAGSRQGSELVIVATVGPGSLTSTLSERMAELHKLKRQVRMAEAALRAKTARSANLTV